MGRLFKTSGIRRKPLTWKQVVFGGGGLMPHLDASSDGQLVCAGDVGGGYAYNSATSKWEQLATQQRMKLARFRGYRGQSGMADIRISWQDSDRIYFFMRETNTDLSVNEARLWRSDDGGANSYPTSYPVNTDASLDSNDQSSSGGGGVRLYAGKIGVDPQNKDVVYATNPGAGKYPLRSLNGGVTWSPITSLPAGVTGYIGALNFTFDPAETVSGRTKRVYVEIVSTSGAGVYMSYDGGDTFTSISSAIVFPGANAVVNDGKFYISHVLSGTRYISRYDPAGAGTWTDIRSNATGRYVLASHATAGKIIAVRTDNLAYEITTDAGAGTPTWTSRAKAAQTYASTDSPWQATRVNAGFGPTPSDAKFVGDVLYLTMGQGIWLATISGTTAPSWETITAGTEELVINQIESIPGANKVAFAGWDEGLWVRSNSTLDTAPAATAMVINNTALNYAWQFAIDPQDTDLVVVAGQSGGGSGSYRVGTNTFTAFTETPDSSGGSGYQTGSNGNYATIAINNGITLWNKGASTGQYPYRSDDLGATTWDALNAISDIPASGDTGWQTSTKIPKKMILADKVNASVFYMTNYRAGLTPNIRGTWRSTDGGATWTRLADLPYVSTAFYGVWTDAVPDREGYLLMTCGHNTNATHPISTAPFYLSRDGGANWSEVNSLIREVSYFGFGKARVTGGWPTVFFAGFYRGIYGVYMVVDGNFSEVLQLPHSDNDPFPLHINDAITAVSGDMGIFGRVYVGFEGNGAVYADAA